MNEEDLLNFSDKESLKNHTDNRYSIQRVLYAYCLIKWLKTFYPNNNEEELYDKHFGGVYYVYIRGCNIDSSNGIYAQTWSNWNELNEAFMNIINKKMGGFK